MKLVRDGFISILSNRIYVLSHDLEDDIFGIPGNVFSNPLEMIAERGFPLIRKFNTLINRSIDAGLVNKIYSDFLYNKTILGHIRNREGIKDISQIVLTLQHLQGAFAVLIAGLIISFVVFLIEIISNTLWYIIFCRKITKSISNGLDKIMIKFQFREKPLKLRKKLK